MARQRDPFTLDLLSWQPPKIEAGYEDEVAGRGALDNRIARLIARALKDAKEAGKKRDEIAETMTAYLNRTVTEQSLNKWSSEGSTAHRIPLDAFVALIDATNADDLLGFIPAMFGFVAVPERYRGIIELHLLEDHEREITARKAALSASIGGVRR